MSREHSFTFEATVETWVHASVTQTEYEDFSEEGESLEEFARRQAEDRAPRDLTMRFADDGVSGDAICLGGVRDHDSWES